MDATTALGMTGVRYAAIAGTERERTEQLASALRDLAGQLQDLADQIDGAVEVDLARARSSWTSIERMHADLQARREVLSVIESGGLGGELDAAHRAHNERHYATARSVRDAGAVPPGGDARTAQ